MSELKLEVYRASIIELYKINKQFSKVNSHKAGVEVSKLIKTLVKYADQISKGIKS